MTLKIRPRPHVSGYFVKQEIFFSVLVCRPPANGVLLKTVPRVEILKNAGFSFTRGRTQTEVFEYDDVIHYILPPSGGYYRISIVLASSCGRAKRIQIRYVGTRIFWKQRKKNFRFENIRIRVDRTEAWIVVSNSVTKSVFQDCV